MRLLLRGPALWVFGVPLVLLAACQTGNSGGLAAAVARAQAAGTGDTGDTTQVTVRVENQSFPDLVIYVIPDGGTQTRIGMANGNTTTVLTVPDYLLPGTSRLRFLLRPIGGGRSQLTEPIYATVGDEVSIMVTP